MALLIVRLFGEQAPVGLERAVEVFEVRLLDVAEMAKELVTARRLRSAEPAGPSVQ